jgi:hypothetical protein
MRTADFGPLVVETDVDLAVLATLKSWLPTYLAQAERQRGLASRLLPRPRGESYANTLEDTEFLDHRLPAIIVTTAAPTDVAQDGDGFYIADWHVVVSAVVRGRKPEETRGIAALYGGCVRDILTDRPTLGGFASATKWIPGGGVAPVDDPTPAGRYLAAGINQFTVSVDDVLREAAGPATADPYEQPDPDAPGYDPDAPWDPLATVRQNGVTVEVEGVPITAKPGA